MKKPTVYYRAAIAAYICIFVFGFFFFGVVINEPYFNPIVDILISIVSLVIGGWQHALRYKYNPKER